jgi:hypothetical protein
MNVIVSVLFPLFTIDGTLLMTFLFMNKNQWSRRSEKIKNNKKHQKITHKNEEHKQINKSKQTIKDKKNKQIAI